MESNEYVNWVSDYLSRGSAMLLLLIITRLLVSGLRTAASHRFALILKSLGPLEGHLDVLDNIVLAKGAKKYYPLVDFGNLVRPAPARAILYPASVADISTLLRGINASVKPSHRNPAEMHMHMHMDMHMGMGMDMGMDMDMESMALTVSARGHAHSLHGQAHAPHGVIIHMESLAASCRCVNVVTHHDVGHMYADVSGGALWIDVLRACLVHGVAPRSWTDYLYLTVGGTLSNAGISGQAFRHGPQISNVLQLEVVTGKGDVVTCSEDENPDLFHATLGGLGQFGIITSARIPLEPAPSRVKWMRALYSDFDTFRRDQEYLISLPPGETFDYIEGFVVPNSETDVLENWRSSLFEPQNGTTAATTIGELEEELPTVLDEAGILYYLEVTKHYNENEEEESITKVASLMASLHCIQSSVHSTDVSYLEFLNRVHVGEEKLRARGLWDIPHPWLNLFVPSDKIVEFDTVVFKKILGKSSAGPIIIYPMNRNKWDERTSVAIPDSEIFYLVAILRSASSGHEEDGGEGVEEIVQQNDAILNYCKRANIGEKQYLPRITRREGWVRHFGAQKWAAFERRKAMYDPHLLLAPGQCIFHRPSHGKDSNSKDMDIENIHQH